ncbi:hypothetical protein NDS46_30430 (plasmid) [Paenibacillus thiaminolyticus]|uniref:hypothetical protein n=1 Tax=Paenibacillus thiaminolyticus TaxID=49283 RepID=UPI00232CC1F6|nr:hypothetical protein [Paenibacillus thiaminolyticus]WCF11666.1 hypothetical protein NDS46_30430 [Paenibacillus thiaminolyticus]
MMNYEAHDEVNDVEIYNGANQSDLIMELSDYIQYQNHINESDITDEEIKNLDREALKRIGIMLFINRW